LNLGLGDGLGLLLELFGEGLVVEEDIRIVELVVPCALEITHGADQLVEFLITDEGDEGGIGAGGLLAIGRVIVIFGAP
jgi:hypothetical protein